LSSCIALSDPAACDPGISGAKGARLAAMYQAGFPVPEAIIVPTATWSALAGSSASAQDVLSLRLPEEFSRSLVQAARLLKSATVAVRSSAVGEDGYEHSLAGQLVTFLNTKPEQVPRKVVECWAARFSDPLKAYRRRRLLAGDDAMAVIIQRQIDADMAGVVFTIDPVRRSADNLVLEWTHGLGDRLVDGRLDPRRCRIARKSGQILDREESPPGDICTEAHRWGLAAERMMNFPADLEWAAEREQFYVLQARPVTAISDGQSVAWTDVNLAENFPHPITPLAWSLVRRFYAAYMRSILPVFGWRPHKSSRGIVDHLIGLQGQRIYYCIDNWYAVLQSFPFSRWMTHFLDQYIGQYVAYRPPVADDVMAGAGTLRRRLAWLTFLPRMLAIIFNAEKRLTRLEKDFARFQETWRRPHTEGMPAGQLAKQLEQRFDLVENQWAAAAMADLLVMIFPGLLGVLAERWLGTPAAMATADLLAGQEVTSIQPSVLIWQMSRLINSDPALAELLHRGQFRRLEAGLPERARRLLDQFMDRFGSRCYLDCMVVMPTFREKHSLFWNLVSQYGNSRRADPASTLEATRLRTVKVRRRFLERLSPLRRAIMGFVIDRSGLAVRLRERGRLLQSLLFGEMRPLILALGRKMVSLGLIAEAQDVFYLRLSEILDIMQGAYPLPETLDETIRLRKEAFSYWKHERPPEFFLARKGEYWKPRQKPPDDMNDERTLTGTPISPGNAKASARVIVDPRQGHLLKEGEVLVTYATDPGWTPLFTLAGALVLERGGVLSHGAIVAREFGIPAVAGIEDACRRIRSGQIVTVDGNSGSVTIEDE